MSSLPIFPKLLEQTSRGKSSSCEKTKHTGPEGLQSDAETFKKELVLSHGPRPLSLTCPHISLSWFPKIQHPRLPFPSTRGQSQSQTNAKAPGLHLSWGHSDPGLRGKVSCEEYSFQILLL
jgi:hypothetical protein